MVNPVHKVKRLVVDEDGTRHWVEEEIVGWLSTGLRDMNGREIFEGDIVDVSVYDCFDDELHQVFFRSGEFVFVGKSDWHRWQVAGCIPASHARPKAYAVVGHVTEEGEE